MQQVPFEKSHTRPMIGVIAPAYRHVINVLRSSSSDARVWMAGALIASCAVSACVVVTIGANERGIDDALLVTGRMSFLLFWPAYVGSAAAALFGSSLNVLKRQARNFGLAFASAHIVHLFLVAWLCYIGAAPPVGTFVFFGVAVVWTYLLAIISIGRLQIAVGQRMWRLINVVGLNYIAFAFSFDFMRFPPDLSFRYVVLYLPFVLLTIGCFGLRICAWAARQVRSDSVNVVR